MAPGCVQQHPPPQSIFEAHEPPIAWQAPIMHTPLPPLQAVPSAAGA